MADLVIGATGVAKGPGAFTDERNTSLIVFQGRAMYLKDDGTLGLCDASTEAKAKAWGLTLNSAAGGQPVRVIRSGQVDLGVALAAGEPYVISSTLAQGFLMPASDLGSGDWTTLVGVAVDAQYLDVHIAHGGQVP